MYATVVPVLLSAVALCAAGPYYLPQQRQLFYPLVPQYQQYQQYQYSAPLVAPVQPYRQFYNPTVYPQASANLVSPVARPMLRYPGSVVAPAKQVLYYPQALPYPHNYVLAGDEAAEGSGGFAWPSWISNFSNYFVGEQPAVPDTNPAAGSEGASPAGEKVEQTENNEKPAKEDEDMGDKENEEAKPEEAKVKGVPQKFVSLQQPQFFGNFGLQRINPAMVLPSANNGAVSSYLLLKNFPGVRFASDVHPQFPQVPQVQQEHVPQTPAEAELVPEGEAGKAAPEYQKLLQETPERQNKEFSDDDADASVTVDAAVTKDKPTSETDAEADKQNDEEETGTDQNISQ